MSAPNPLRCEIEGVTLRDLEFSAALGSLTGTLLFGGLRSVYTDEEPANPMGLDQGRDEKLRVA